jgi:hypothetical protein
MTQAEVAELIGYINLRWEHAPLSASVHSIWVEDLGPLPAEACLAAVRRWARSGEKFPPTSGWVFSEVERDAQASSPGFGDVGTVVERTLVGPAFLREVYSPDGHYGPEQTARAIEIMAARSAHEAVLRFVLEQGLGAVLMMPDGARFPLDRNQAADRRDMARHYNGVTVPGWRADPSPGLALSRARVALGDGQRDELRAIDPARHLGAGS